MLTVWQGGAVREAAGLKFKAAGVVRIVRSCRVLVSGTLRPFYTASSDLSLAVTPETKSAAGFNSTVTSSAFTATPIGGVAPFSYAWSVVSYEGSLPTAVNPTSSSSGFRQTGLAVGDENDVVVRCTATDALGGTASDEATLTFRRESLS